MRASLLDRDRVVSYPHFTSKGSLLVDASRPRRACKKGRSRAHPGFVPARTSAGRRPRSDPSCPRDSASDLLIIRFRMLENQNIAKILVKTALFPSKQVHSMG